jgi:phage gpG-like protein
MGTVAELNDYLRSMKARVPFACAAAAEAMGLLFTAEVKLNELSRFTHPPHSSWGWVTSSPGNWSANTNSPPGSPPALVSGALRASVIPSPPVVTGDSATVIVGGTTVYARIQELGGWAGKGDRSHLPPRPYLKPALERLVADKRLTQAAVKGWLAVMGL